MRIQDISGHRPRQARQENEILVARALPWLASQADCSRLPQPSPQDILVHAQPSGFVQPSPRPTSDNNAVAASAHYVRSGEHGSPVASRVSNL